MAVLRFTGDEPKKQGITVTFSLDKGNATYTATSDGGGSASVSILIDSGDRDMHERPFADLDNEGARERGEEGASYLTPDGKSATANDKVKRRVPAAFDSLERESARVDEDVAPADDEGGDVRSTEALVSADWEDDSDEDVPMETALGLYPGAQTPPPAAASPNVGLSEPESVPLQKLYALTVTAKASAGPMGSASGSAPAAIMSNRCPPGTMADPDSPDLGQPGQPPLGSPAKLALDRDCRESEELSDDACRLTATKACKDGVLLVVGYDFRACLKRWEPDADGTAGSLGTPPSPKARRVPPSRRCIPAARAKTLSISPVTSYAKGKNDRHGRTVARGARVAYRLLIKKLLMGARFFKNKKTLIFERSGGYAALSGLFDEVTAGAKVNDSDPDVKTASLPGGVTIALRRASKGTGGVAGPATVQVGGPNGERVKIRAP
ncbi:MAG: hypothetical protein ABL955_05915 [Elusimicrobiota bacterium]